MEAASSLDNDYMSMAAPGLVNIEETMELYVYNEDGSSAQSLTVTAGLHAADLCELLAVKSQHVTPDIGWCLVERWQEPAIERIVEDSEDVPTVYRSMLAANYNAIFCFRKCSSKYDFFDNPQVFFPDNMTQLPEKVRPGKFSGALERTIALQSTLTSVELMPDVFGWLWVSGPDMCVWKRAFFWLRNGTLYRSQLDCQERPALNTDHFQLFVPLAADWLVYWTSEARRHFRAPCDHALVLRRCHTQDTPPAPPPPSVAGAAGGGGGGESQLLCLACESVSEHQCWLTALRLARYGRRLFDSFSACRRQLHVRPRLNSLDSSSSSTLSSCHSGGGGGGGGGGGLRPRTSSTSGVAGERCHHHHLHHSSSSSSSHHHHHHKRHYAQSAATLTLSLDNCNSHLNSNSCNSCSCNSCSCLGRQRASTTTAVPVSSRSTRSQLAAKASPGSCSPTAATTNTLSLSLQHCNLSNGGAAGGGVRESEVHLTQPWYHGNISSNEATHLLSPNIDMDGVFLVRSSRSVTGGHVLCFTVKHRVCPVQILPHMVEVGGTTATTAGGGRVRRQCVSLDNGHTNFYDVLQLIEFYQLNRGALPTRLTRYVSSATGRSMIGSHNKNIINNTATSF